MGQTSGNFYLCDCSAKARLHWGHFSNGAFAINQTTKDLLSYANVD